MITHYMDEAAMADRVIVLNRGSIVLDGTPHEVFAHEEELRSFGLDVPQCTSLVHQLREVGIELVGDCVTPEECAALISAALGKEGSDGKDNG